jgi:FkbM family methyltransferase
VRAAIATARWLVERIPQHTVLPILSGPLRGKKWVVRSSFKTCWLGVYEKAKLSTFERWIKPHDVVHDIGANVGYHTLLASVLAGPQGKVFAFEPLPRNLEILKRHLQMNRVTNVEVVEVALADRSATARFDPAAHPEAAHLSEAGAIEVATVPLDELIASRRVAPPNLMKIDVEGAEWVVLQGARESIARYRPVILLATHGPQVHERCLAFLRQQAYEVRALDGGSPEETDELLATAPPG